MKNEVTRKGLKNIERTVPGKPRLHSASGSHGEVGILDREYDGKGFYQYVKKEFYNPDFPSDRFQTAINITSRARDGHLINASNDPMGRKALYLIYNELVSKPDHAAAQKQADRIMKVMGSFDDINQVTERIAKGTWVIPAKFTVWDPANIKAELKEDGNIWFKINQLAQDTYKYDLLKSGVPQRAFSEGLKIDPQQWVGFKLYDEGKITLYRPALYLLLLSSKCTKETWKNIFDIGSLGLPGGPFLKLGGIFQKGAGLVVEKLIDTMANVLLVGNIAVRENRGWIIEKYGDKGREFIEKFDTVSTIAGCYGIVKALSAPALRKGVEKLGQVWKEMKESKKVDGADLEKLNKVDQSVEKFVKTAEETQKKIEKEYALRPDGSPPKKKTDASTDKAWRDQEDQVFDRQMKDGKAGVHEMDEFGVVMHVKQADNPKEMYQKIIKQYPDREADLIRDVATKEHYIVLGAAEHFDKKANKMIPGAVDYSAVSRELKGKKFEVLGHYHNRLGPGDHVVMFPSSADYRHYFGETGKGGLCREGDIITIRYLDKRAKNLLESYFTRLPADYESMDKTARGVLERHFKGRLHNDQPYVMIFQDPLTKNTVAKQFKDLDSMNRYISHYDSKKEFPHLFAVGLKAARERLQRESGARWKPGGGLPRPGQLPKIRETDLKRKQKETTKKNRDF